MAATLRLTDGTTTVDLLTDAAIKLRQGGLSLPPPPLLSTWGGNSIMRDGADLVDRHYGNRTITMRLRIEGANHDAMIDNINSLNAILRTAMDTQRYGWGTEVHLEYKWTDATATVYFDVLTGELRLPEDLMSSILDNSETIRDAVLTLICRPYAHGTLSGSHENYCDNPSFEHGAAPGDSWTEENGADVTTSMDTTNKKYGAQSVQLVCVLDAANDTGIYSDNIACAAAASTGYIQAWGRHVSGDKVSVEVWDVTNGAWCTLGADIFWNAANSTWTKVGTTFAKPVNCLNIRVYIHVEATDSSAGATIQVDAVYCNPVHGSTAPTFWLSSRNLINHIDSDADHINYVDVEDIDSEQEAGIRIAGLVGEITRRWRQTPYLYGQNYDSADGALEAGMGTTVNAVYQGGSAANTPSGAQATWSTIITWTVNTNMVHRYGRIRMFLAYAALNNNGGTGTLRVGLRWGSTPTIYYPKGDTGSGDITMGSANVRAWLDAGVFELPPTGLLPRDGEVDEWRWVVQFKMVGTNGFNIDCLHLGLSEEGYVLGNTSTGPNVHDTTQEPPYWGRLVTIGDDTTDWSQDITAPVGNPLYAAPNRQNRYYWRSGTDITTTGTVRMKAMPRYLLVG